MFEIPTILHGDAVTARSRVHAAVRSWLKGMTWNTALEAEGTIDPREFPGLLLLNGPVPSNQGKTQFHVYLPLSEASGSISTATNREAIESDVFAASLQSASGVLGLLCPANLTWIHPRERHASFLRAVAAHWKDLDAIGPRYSVGSNAGARLWDIHPTIKYVLANRGVDGDVLREAIPPDGVRRLVDEVLDHLAEP